ncbi:hypothetical protein L596_019014 [Steinernema carpocapsae]|uniref:Uncharacterized protein n=1 Tax=Steinernema carpocapsae TaxID=34508 RepID=A0A4U5N6W8_STECR|nr:hypothetical protein L596_019014 [Steinernema carpocapsae]
MLRKRALEILLAESPTTSALRLGWPSATVVLNNGHFSIFKIHLNTAHLTLLPQQNQQTPFQTPKPFPDTPTPQLSFPTEP